MTELLARFAQQHGLDALQAAALPTVAAVLDSNGIDARHAFTVANSSPNPALALELVRLATVGAAAMADAALPLVLAVQCQDGAQ